MVDSLLITGGSGLLALNWAMHERGVSRVVLGLHERIIAMPGTEARLIDLRSSDGIGRVIDAVEPRLVVHTAALTSVEACEADPPRAHMINVQLATHVAQSCAQRGVPLVHISTDHLFSGDEALIDEMHPVDPVNVYGRTKAEAEVRVLASHPDALVIRTNIYGWGPRYRPSFSDSIIESLRAGRSVTLLRDVFYTPILIEHLVQAVHALIDRKVRGVFHVTGDDRVSKLDFGLMLAKEFALDADLIHSGLLSERLGLVPRPHDMSLSNAKLRATLGRAIGGPKVHLVRLREQEQVGQALELGRL